MAETNPQTTEAVVVTPEKEPSRLQVFVAKHPRAAKVAAVTGAIGTVLGSVLVVKTLQSNKAHLELAGDHAKEALNELSTSVSPQDAEA